MKPYTLKPSWESGIGRIKITQVAHHRNGIGGEGFYVVLFECEKRKMVATVFEEPGMIAVYDVGLLAEGNVAFAKGNSWRGDHYEPTMRIAIAKYEASW